MNLQDIAILESKFRHRGEGAVAHDDHVAARELEEPLDIGEIFAAAVALSRQTAGEAELAAEADGDDGADIGDFHENLPASASSVSSRAGKASRRRIKGARKGTPQSGGVHIAGLGALWQAVISSVSMS